jgi:hypothetical protein
MKTLFFGLLGTLILTSVASFGSAKAAIASETVVLKYGISQESISVRELGDFARGGEPSSSLKSYLRMVDRKPEALQALLSSGVYVDGVFLYRVLQSFPGEILLDSVSEIIKTPSARASRESLRSALVSSALKDGQITTIEILENYPTSEVYLEGDYIVNIYKSIRSVLFNL